MIQMIRVLEPYETMYLSWIMEDIRHDRIKCETISNVTTESDIAEPGRWCRGVAILLFGHRANVRFLRGFWKSSNEFWRVDPVGDGEVKDGIIRWNGYSGELRIDGVWSSDHGGFQRKHHVQRLLNTEDGQNEILNT